MSYYSLSLKSYNQKTGPIPVSTSSADTCPPSCPFNGGGCYAQEGPLRFHWAKVTSGERGMSWEDFCAAVAALPEGQLWRHNQAGDLPSYTGAHIDREMLQDLVAANHRRRGFTYTHRYADRYDLETVHTANKGGFTVNLSADNPAHADKLVAYRAGPVTVVLPSWETRKEFKTPGGNSVRLCPAVYIGRATCENCGLCQQTRRPYIIGIPAHGSGVVKVDKIVEKDRLLRLF